MSLHCCKPIYWSKPQVHIAANLVRTAHVGELHTPLPWKWIVLEEAGCIMCKIWASLQITWIWNIKDRPAVKLHFVDECCSCFHLFLGCPGYRSLTADMILQDPYTPTSLKLAPYFTGDFSQLQFQIVWAIVNLPFLLAECHQHRASILDAYREAPAASHQLVPPPAAEMATPSLTSWYVSYRQSETSAQPDLARTLACFIHKLGFMDNGSARTQKPAHTNEIVDKNSTITFWKQLFQQLWPNQNKMTKINEVITALLEKYQTIVFIINGSN